MVLSVPNGDYGVGESLDLSLEIDRGSNPSIKEIGRKDKGSPYGFHTLKID